MTFFLRGNCFVPPDYLNISIDISRDLTRFIQMISQKDLTHSFTTELFTLILSNGLLSAG